MRVVKHRRSDQRECLVRKSQSEAHGNYDAHRMGKRKWMGPRARGSEEACKAYTRRMQGENVRAGHGTNEMGEPAVQMEGRKRPRSPVDMEERSGMEKLRVLIESAT